MVGLDALTRIWSRRADTVRTYSFAAAGRPGHHTERRARASVLSRPKRPRSGVAWGSCSTCARIAPVAGTQKKSACRKQSDSAAPMKAEAGLGEELERRIRRVVALVWRRARAVGGAHPLEDVGRVGAAPDVHDTARVFGPGRHQV